MMQWSVWFERRERARFEFVEEAAVLVAFFGDGAEIRFGGRVVWKEGKEDQPAAESYDHVADRVDARAFRR